MAFDLKIMVADKIQEMTESATIRMAQKARELASKGVNVISLSLGEPDFDTPEHIKDAAIDGLHKGMTKYTPVSGTLELKNAIIRKMKRDSGLEYQGNQIVISNGAKQSIFNICTAVIDPGDEVIIFAPYWVSYFEIVKFCNGTPVIVSAGIEDEFKVSAAQVAAAITPKTRMIIFSSPCNPTGSVFTGDELAAIAEVIKAHDNIVVVSDEIYEYINFQSKHASIASVPGMQDITAVVNGFSKGFSMTGWRLGFMAGPAWLASACDKVQGQVTSGAASFSQHAAAVGLDSDMGPTMEMTRAFKKRRDLVIDQLKQIPGLIVNNPQGAFYVFPDVSYYFGKSDGTNTIQNADDFSEIMLAEAHVGLVSGSAFGADQCIRISYAASEEDLTEAIKRLKNCLSKFK
ncbi:MAG: pyridoxal phosphate-dependent aminotransferase [Saprospiraceae bacterium]|nr:pyridoxal phosphate-dependent aminotransferase [Saprospiraceae bacterium]MBK8110056.1 pyridoxal phosphate-dependent aminotransferase [Saprospiraceae bacterium]